MQALHAQKGFEVQHQRVVLDLDFDSKTINASCFISIIPLNPALRTVYLNASPELVIHDITLSSSTPSDPFFDTPASYTLTDPFHAGRLETTPDCRDHPAIKRRTWAAIDEADEGELAISVSGGWIRLVEGERRLAPIDIRIDYTISPGGVSFEEGQICLMAGGRTWTPCIDSIWARCTWELVYIVPHTRSEHVVRVASSGELLEQLVHPNTSTKTIFSHLQTIPTSVRHIGFLASTANIADVDERIIAFGETAELDFVSRAMIYYTTEFGTYPYQDFKIAFVQDLPAVAVYACLVLLPSEMACDSSIIEASIELREVIVLALAQQWIGVNVIPRETSDTWIVNGLALYIRSLCLRHLFGNNEYRYRLKKDIDRCVRIDQGSKAPICVPGSASLDIAFINLKAPLVLHILDRHLAKTGTALGLSRVIPRIFLSALSDELGHGNSLSTPQFFRICRKITGIDLGGFADQWIFGSRCPHFKIHTNFIRKKFLVELTVVQAQAVFEGSLTIRIHEADGAPFEHIVDVKHPTKTFNLPFNTKYKRTRRSGKIAARFQHLQDQLEADEGEVPVAAEVFAYPPWDREDVRQEWRVGEWSEEQANTMMGEGGGYEWIRIDPECEWLAWFDFPERPWYWISQLQGDRDVVAQIQAVQNLSSHLSPVVASELARVALVRNYYYRVRMEAVKAIVAFNCPDADFMGSFLLLKLFRHFHKDFNDFTDMPDYFVAKAVHSALGDLRNVPEAKLALIEALQLNDNSRNAFDDSYHLANITSALGSCTGDHLRRETNDIIDRLLTMDRLVPSYRNLVTQAGLTTLMKAILGGQRINDPRPFLSYTREGSILAVRELAFDCLLVCRPPGRNRNITDFVLEVIRLDEYRSIRRYAACALSEAILVSLSLGEIVIPAVEPDDLAIVKAVRREFFNRPGLVEGVNTALIRSYTTSDKVTRLALVKVAEIIAKGNAEIPQSRTMAAEPPAATPKIRLSLSSDFPFPAMPPPIKVTLKKKSIPKAQTSGLSDGDLLAISNALKKLKSHKSSLFFRQPVDPIRDHAPDYPVIIKNPMDLSTVGAKLDNGVYRSRAEFVNDIRLIISNCMLYNRAESPVYNAAKAMQSYFDQLWAKTEATLSMAPGVDGTQNALEPPIETIRLEIPRQEPVRKEPSRSDTAVAKIKLKPTVSVPPMAPPPVPAPRKQSETKKRVPSAVDEVLGAELDAIEGHLPVEPKRLKIIKPPTPHLPAPPIPTNASIRHELPRMTIGLDVPFKQKRAKALVTMLKQDPNSPIFHRPVDPIADGCPTYLDEIKEPMDLGTTGHKIDSKKYRTMGELARDIELIFANCRQFNPPGPITDLADNLEAVYRKEWPKVVSTKMTAEEKKAMSGLIGRALKERSSVFFREPVDPIKQNVPQYFDIIPKEDARDLSLIKRKLQDGKYDAARQVDEDVELMVENARMFNGDGPVVQQANELSAWWTSQRQRME